MNKAKMGKFIEDLRKAKKWSQNYLAEKLSELHLDVSKNAISSWERGITIPDIEKLYELANLFNVSIDEILDGERKVDIDYSTKYLISNPNRGVFQKDDLYNQQQEQIIEINKRFKDLLKIRVSNQFTNNEEKEFRFLFENFYKLTDHYKEYTDIKDCGDYFILKSAIKLCLEKIKNMDDEDKLWEIGKFIIPKENIDFGLYDISDQVPAEGSNIDTRFKQLEFWQRDMILTSIQVCDPISIHREALGSKNLKMYEERTGQDYNAERITKDIIKYLIENGACINKRYLKYYKKVVDNKRIIDRLEELYILCEKPITGLVEINNELQYYRVENNLKNRFINYYYYSLHADFDYPFEELFKIFSENDEIPEFALLDLAKKNGMDTNQDMKYVIADLILYKNSALRQWESFKQKEKKIADGLIEMKNLLHMLENGEKFYHEIKTVDIGGQTWGELRDYYYYCNTFVTLDELKNSREIEKTNELLSKIDNLSMQQIRDEYFKMEEIDNVKL